MDKPGSSADNDKPSTSYAKPLNTSDTDANMNPTSSRTSSVRPPTSFPVPLNPSGIDPSMLPSGSERTPIGLLNIVHATADEICRDSSKEGSEFIERLLDYEQEEPRGLSRDEQEAMALGIIKRSYLDMIQQEQQSGKTVTRLRPDLEFKLFQDIVAEMFETYVQLQLDDRGEFGSGVIPWMKENCKPHQVREMVKRAMETNEYT